MRSQIIFTETEKRIIEQIDYIDNSKYPPDYKKFPDLSIDQVLTICSEVFGVSRLDLVQKMNKPKPIEKIRKEVLLAGLYFFTNVGSDDCREFANYKYAGRASTWSRLNYERSRMPEIMKFFVELDKACAKRLSLLAVAEGCNGYRGSVAHHLLSGNKDSYKGFRLVYP